MFREIFKEIFKERFNLVEFAAKEYVDFIDDYDCNLAIKFIEKKRALGQQIVISEGGKIRVIDHKEAFAGDLKPEIVNPIKEKFNEQNYNPFNFYSELTKEQLVCLGW